MNESLIKIRHYDSGLYGMNGYYWFHPDVENGPPRTLHGTESAARQEALEALDAIEREGNAE